MKQRNKQNSRPKNPKHWAKVPRFKVRSLTSDRKSLNMLTSKLCCWPISWCHWSQQGFCVFFDHWVDVWDWSRTRHFQNKTRQRAPQSTGGHHNNKNVNEKSPQNNHELNVAGDADLNMKKRNSTQWTQRWDVFREFSMKQKQREMSNKMESDSVITPSSLT